ncbi:regulatory protein [Sphingomonas sp. PvP055]|uniref:regulatory protein RecX n=1 Tax=Sphingomonas sp. PvP055 TaxID=3156391 RepID=UPI00339884A1
MYQRPKNQTPTREKKPIPPLDSAALERIALRYVERFSTTRAKLAAYLVRKVRERGWEGPERDPAGIAEKFAELGYINDRAFGEARAVAMARRGLGQRRVAGVLRQSGLNEDDTAAIVPGVEERAVETALAFAKRRRFGPFALQQADAPLREKQIAAMIRGGHGFTIARKIVNLMPGESFETFV